MPTYLYECPTHGLKEITKPMAQSGHPEWCPDCYRWVDLSVVDVPPMRRLYTPPRVQNLTASENTLRTWGRDLRVERGVTDVEGLIRGRRERDAALAREGAPPPRAATMTEEG